jgi:hypothetical protein
MKKLIINMSIDTVHFFSFYMAYFHSNDNFMNVAIFLAWVYSLLFFALGVINFKGLSSEENKKSTGISLIYHWSSFLAISLILSFLGYFVIAGFYVFSYIFVQASKEVKGSKYNELLSLYNETRDALKNVLCITGQYLEGDIIDMDDTLEIESENKIKRAIEISKKEWPIQEKNNDINR